MLFVVVSFFFSCVTSLRHRIFLFFCVLSLPALRLKPTCSVHQRLPLLCRSCCCSRCRWIDLFVDLYFTSDLIMNFRTAYFDRASGILITGPGNIARNYLTGWFTIDLLSCLPISYIALALKSADDDDQSDGSVRGPGLQFGTSAAVATR